MAGAFESQHNMELDGVAEALYKKSQAPSGTLTKTGRRVSDFELPDGERQDVAADGEQPEPGTEPESPDGEPEAEPGTEPESPDGEPEAEPDDPDAVEAEPEEFVELELDGKTQKVAVPELVKGYMLQADYTRKTQALAKEREDWTRERGQSLAAEQEAVAIVYNLSQQLQAELGRVLPTPQEMEQLRVTDPGEWSARMNEQNRRQQLIAMARGEQARVERARMEAAIPGERDALVRALPEDFKDFPRAYSELSLWVTTPAENGGGGLTQEEWSQVIDHRLVRLAQLAFAEDKRRKATTEATRKGVTRIQKAVSTQPRVRAGATTGPKTAAERRYVDATRNLERHPDSNQAIADVLLERERARRRGAPGR